MSFLLPHAGDMYGKFSSIPCLADYCNISVITFTGLIHQKQADPVSVLFGGDSILQDILPQLFRNLRTGVSDRDINFLGGLHNLQRHCPHGASLQSVKSIFQQIPHNQNQILQKLLRQPP